MSMKLAAIGLALLGIVAGGAAYAQAPQRPPPNMMCPDKIVWVDISSRVYFTQSDQHFGRTQQGKFVCESAALREGNHLSR